MTDGAARMNLNDRVWFRFRPGCEHIAVSNPEISEEGSGWYSTQLWCFCREFGPRLRNGVQPEIEKNELRLTPPPLQPCDSEAAACKPAMHVYLSAKCEHG